MRRCAATLVLALFACNGGDRDEGPLSGTAGLSAGEGGTGTLTTGISGAEASAGETDASASDDAPDDASDTSASAGEASASAASTTGDGTGQTEDATTATSEAESSGDASSSSSGGELADGVLDVTIVAHNDCTFTVTPSSITVPEGTEFTVNWISSGSSEVEFDIAKIDDFNQVPIILGMEPGSSYHDEVREWCGDLFTGTFDFRLTSCFEDHYIPVDCGG